MAVLFSLPSYVPDATTSESVVGYDVQACTPTAGLPLFTGTWTTVSGSPFASPKNIVDSTGTAATQYRARPIRQVTVAGSPVTLDTPYSAPFIPDQPLYDAWFTRSLLPKLRSVYLKDTGTMQSCGTVLAENIGAGQGLWKPNGTTKRFYLQYVKNDDPLTVVDSSFRMIRRDSTGTPVQCLPDVEYSVDLKNGAVEFAGAPADNDYLRFDFAHGSFVNADLLAGLESGVNALSQFGINGYQIHKENNLRYMTRPLNEDLGEIVCKIAIWLMAHGSTEAALLNTMSWRDGGIQSDPLPSRALQFVTGNLGLNEASLQKRANAYIRANTVPITRGDFDMEFDFSPFGPAWLPNIYAPIGMNITPFYLWWM